VVDKIDNLSEEQMRDYMKLAQAFSEEGEQAEEKLVQLLPTLDPAVASDFKKQMTSFYDLSAFAQEDVIVFLKNIDADLLLCALKGSVVAVVSTIIGAMSKAASASFLMDFEATPDMDQLSIDVAQVKVLKVIQKLVESEQMKAPEQGDEQ
jgi:flagellar motor switch protein FliG